MYTLQQSWLEGVTVESHLRGVAPGKVIGRIGLKSGNQCVGACIVVIVELKAALREVADATLRRESKLVL